jgi:signal peptide peptidase SppA
MTRWETFLRGAAGKPMLVSLKAAVSFTDAGEERLYRVQGGVALVPVYGLLGDSWYCWTTYGEIQAQVAQALGDSAVSAIALVIDSPGGYTDGAFETAAAIAAAGKQKPVSAVVEGCAYSAAYLLASQAEDVYLAGDVTGGVGSIGVYCEHDDYSEALKMRGIDVTLISAGEGKTDGNPYEPLTPEAKAKLQADVDRLYGEFVGAVARGRGMTPDAVVKLGAHCYDGAKAALAAGLVDEVGGLSLALGKMAGARGFAARAAEEGRKMEQQEIDKLVSEARAAGFGDAQEVVELCEVAGRRDLIAGFVGSKKPAADVRKDLLAARAAAAGPELNTGSMPGDDTKGADKGKGKGQASPWRDVLAKAGIRAKKEVA